MRTRTFTPVIALAIALAGPAARAGDAERKLQEAFYAEVAEHDLEAAMAGYREVIALPGLDAGVAARAHLRLGICLSMRGERIEAARHLRRAKELGGGAIREEAEKLLAEIETFTPAKAMPADPLLYLEFDAPGEKLLQLLELVVEAGLDEKGIGGKLLENPTFLEEVRKIRSAAVTITGGEPGRPTGVGVVVLEKDSALATFVRLFISSVGAEKRTHEGAEIWRVAPRGRRLQEVFVAFRGNLIVFGAPGEEVDAAIDRLAKGEPSLAASQAFVLATARYRRPGSLVAYTDGPKLLETLGAVHPPSARDRVLGEALEVDRLSSLAVRVLFEEALSIEGEARFTEERSPRLARILRSPVADPSVLAWIPPETAATLALSIDDGESFWKELGAFAEEVYDKALAAGVVPGERPSVALARLDEALGMSVGRDVLGNVEAAAVAFREPPREGGESPILVLKVKDAEAAGETARRFLARLGEHIAGTPVAVQTDATGAVPIQKVTLSPALEPCFALVKRTLILGPRPARVREAIACREAAEGVPAVLGGEAIPEGARKLLVLRPAAMARGLGGPEARGWGIVAEAAGDAPVLIWTEEEEGRIAVKARIPNLPGLIQIAAKKKNG